MSLGLHFDCRPFPWCCGLVHLHLARKASATLRKLIWFAIRRAISISDWHASKLQLNGFRNWCITNEFVGNKYRFEYVYIYNDDKWIINLYLCNVWVLYYIYVYIISMSEVAMVCMTYSEDLMKPISVRLWYLWPDWNSWSPASAWEVLAPIQQPIVKTYTRSKRDLTSQCSPFSLLSPLWIRHVQPFGQ